MQQYLNLVQHVLQRGTRKPNRTGVDTLSTFGYYYEHHLGDGFPLLTTKSVSWKNIVIEMLWFLSGSTSIEFLRDHGCKFWDAWADEDGEVPSAYGNFWRAFPVLVERSGSGFRHGFNDQITWAVDELKRNPMSRRVVVSAWAPENAQTSKLPPCHCMFICNVQNDPIVKAAGSDSVSRRRLCLHLTQRSCDIALGVPYNIAGYALLMHLLGRFTGLEVGIFGHTLVDAHIYCAKLDGSMSEYDHVPGLRHQLKREPRGLPELELGSEIQDLDDIDRILKEDWSTDRIMEQFQLVGYNPHPAINFKVAV